ncbi:hypothetical protein [uncultured Ruminococcus sp.]|uniref:hypothetical protein n=1 Tax=uncultured Ruminococcus sp. TaxID=165186 RepID=UPI00262D8853|nr:hypothetical protein [uncultured Ruminococcus sp.]
MKKFELTNESIIHNGRKLYRIKALINFSDVAAGDFGGYIEKKTNLSQNGEAWVYGDAMVYGDARVYGDAKVCGDANIKNVRDILYSFGLGSEGHGTTFFRTRDDGIAVNSGCFYGKNLQEFEERVKQERSGTIYEREYLSYLQTVKIHFGVEE